MSVCASCKKQIRTCEECGGLLCSPDCPDRLTDGCTCDDSEHWEEDEEKEEQ